MKEIKVKLTFTEPILGTSPANPEVYREFIGSKSPDALSVEDEVAALGADAVVRTGLLFGDMPAGRLSGRRFVGGRQTT